jgi:hypothetical protein
MTDVKILVIRDLLHVTKVEIATMNPFSLDLQGEDFNRATSVLINDLPSPEYIILAKNHMLAQVPLSLKNSPITKVTVLAEQPAVGRDSLLHFEVQSLKKLTGIQRLVQLFCKFVLQTAGSDKFNPTVGGGLLQLVGSNIDRSGQGALAAAISSAVTRTRDQIFSMQSKNPAIPPDERLLSATTEAVGFDSTTTTVHASVLLRAMSGDQAVANLTSGNNT